MNFLWPDVLADSRVFEQAITFHQVDASKKDDTDMDMNEELMESIRIILQNLMLRRQKKDVLRLPEKTIRDVWLPACPLTVEYIKLIYK